jgi:hypothetical protein
VPEHEEFGVLTGVMVQQHRGDGQQSSGQLVQQRHDHWAMISTLAWCPDQALRLFERYRLKQLHGRGLIERTVIPSTPVQITYALTPEAEELFSLLQPLSQWSERHLPHHDA